MNPFDSRFVANLHALIAEDLQRLHTELGNGSQMIADDAAASGMRCARQIGVIAGLKAALGHIQQINDEMSGKSDKKKED